MVSCCISTQALKQVSRMDQIDQMESNGLHSTKPGSNGQMASCCLSTQAVKQVSRMDHIHQMESNGLHSIKPSQMVKWCLVASAERL